jgi:tRNA nucleotidyltransferase (CCA-adding enzyme)
LTLELARRVAEAVAREGGRALLVGGYVRDRLLGIEAKELDIEVFGLSFEKLERLLSTFGEVIHVGKAFGVFRVKGLDVDFSLPRRDNKVRPGHTGFDVAYDPGMSFADAARRRDLTMNAIGLDPLTLEYLDPHGGRRDLREKRLRATDPVHFREDPLRGLRVAGFAARFEMAPDDELKKLCSELDLSELSAERVFAELEKLLLRSEKPSIGFELLRETTLLRFFPEVEALVGVPQEPDWHPEGDVWIHTMMVLDEAAKLQTGNAEDDLPLMYGALAHDFGKPATTRTIGGRITSYEHDVKGAVIAEAFLEKLRAPKELTKKVEALVRHHLAPALFHKNGATAKAYRRLARDLDASGVRPDQLLRVATADHLGRTTDDAFARRFPSGEQFKNMMESLELTVEAPKDVVLGRHLIARGLRPGPEFGRLLAECRDVQDETGWDDPERILDRVLGETDPRRE